MWRKVTAVALVILCLFTIVYPGIARADFVITEAIKEGIFWAMSRSIGISSENAGQGLAQAISDEINLMAVKSSDGTILGAISDYFYSRLDVQVLNSIWEGIKSDIVDLGTVRYSDGTTVPNMKIKVTSTNKDKVKLLAYEVQEFWKERGNLSNTQNTEWLTINDLYGGYLSYMQNYVGDYFYMYCNPRTSTAQKYSYNTSFGSISDSTGFATLGMDMYEILGEGTYKQLTHFDEELNAVTFLQNSNQFNFTWNGTNHAGYIRMFFRYPITFSTQSTVKISLNEDAYTCNVGTSCYWNSIALMDENNYSEWYSNYSNNATYNSQTYVVDQFNDYAIAIARSFDSPMEVTIPAGNYYLVAYLYMNHSSNYSWQLNTPYVIRNTFDTTLSNASVFDRERIFGVARNVNTSVMVPDSGTGTGTSTVEIPDALGLVFPGMYEPDITDDPAYPYAPDIYFPGSIDTVGQLNDVLNPSSEYVTTGEISAEATPSNGGGDPVSVDLTPPASLGFGDIWHYVSDTMDYCTHFIYVMFTTIIPELPTPLLNLVWASVVLGLLFGLYRRFIN